MRIGRIGGALLVSALVLSACQLPGHHATRPSSSIRTPVASTQAGEYQLLTEPNQGVASIYSFIRSARHSLDMVMYELEDGAAERDLAVDATRGVDVRVILNRQYTQSHNAPAYRYLAAHHVHVHWAPRAYFITHEKSIVVDNSRALIMTLNLTSQYYSTSRDFGVFDHNPADVRAMVQVFNADFAGKKLTHTPRGADLIWSPGSAPGMLSVIDGAHHTLLVESEEMNSSQVVGGLCAAAYRGVKVQVIMTRSYSWYYNFDKLVRCGVHVATYSYYAKLYIHAKVTVADAAYPDRRAYVGSINFSDASMYYNRELGLVLGPSESPIIAALSATLRHDYAGGQLWRSR